MCAHIHNYKSDKEIVGTLRGFDEYVNMVLDDVTEIEISADGRKEVCFFLLCLNCVNIL